MKIVKLKAENIKKLVAVEITPRGDVVKITGRNGSGKTSVLDAIYWALAGTANIQEQPIREPETKASVELDLGEMVVKRRFSMTKEGETTTTSLVIENKDGLRFPSPQTMLDGLLGKLSFDPLEFMRQRPRDQFDTLRSMVNLDFSDLDTERKEIYDQRTGINRDVARLVREWELLKLPDDCPTTEVSLQDIMSQIEQAQELQKQKDAAQREHDRTVTEKGQVESRLTAVGEQIVELEKKLDAAKKEHQGLQQDLLSFSDVINDLREKIEGIVVPDTTEFSEQLKTAEATNAQARKWQQGEKIRAEERAARQKAQDITTSLNEIEKKKRDLIAKTQLPLPELGFAEDHLTYKGHPLDQASAAEQLRVSVAIAMALNPQLRILRITDGSLLDSTSMKVLEQMCAKGDFQLWLEVVDESGKMGIVIDDGRVVAVNDAESQEAV